MTKSAKAVNWSAETTEQLVAAYAETKDLAVIAQKFGKTVPAIRSKLVSLEVYQKQEPRAVGGASSTRKIQLVKQIAGLMNQNVEAVESLEKANKEALELLIKFLTPEVVQEPTTE